MMSPRLFLRQTCAHFVALGLAVGGGLAASSEASFDLFEQHIRPVLIQHCYPCHSASAPQLQGDFSAETREGLRRGGQSGRPAVVPHDEPASRLLAVLTGTDPEFRTHPKSALTASEIAHFVTWVNQGAPDPRENANNSTQTPPRGAAETAWAFQPLTRVSPPTIQSSTVLARTPIDRFIAAKLEEKGLQFSPPASRRQLLRRAALTLTGLLPTPDAFAAFEQDSAPGAWTRAVDRLLGSPRYGERWARHWLDVARFAESSGFEHDYDRPNAWPYRDYVIHAFNIDQPYDEFVRWQLAGDEIAPQDPFALMATGFLGAGVFPTQITANEVERARYDALDDMAATTGAAFLGLSVGCARCHDHKFDPIATRDYYRLISTFATTVRSHVEVDLVPEENAARLRSWERSHAEVVVARDRFERENLSEQFETWLASVANQPATLQLPPWLVLDAAEARSAGGATLTPQPDGSLLASGKNPDFDRYTFVARLSLPRITALRIEALADPSFTKGGPGRADNGNFALSDLQVAMRPLDNTNATVPVKLKNPRATFEQKGLPIAAALDEDPKSGWAVDPEFGKNHAAVFEFAEPLELTGGGDLTVTLEFSTNNKHSIGRPRLSVATTEGAPEFFADSAPEKLVAEISTSLVLPASARSSNQVDALRAWFRRTNPEWLQLEAQVNASLAAKPKPKLTTVMVATEGLEPIRMHTQGADFFEQTYFLKRGDVNQKGDVMSQGFLPVLMHQPASFWQVTRPEGARTSFRRRALAHWITDPQDGAGVLLARVLVNRIWALHFGRGLVATPNDFGRQGELPTHPELLDWLASEFMRSGWSVKALHRLILNSAVWQQASPSSLAAAGSPNDHASPNSIDPENRWLWHFPRHRLEGEAIRDNLLAVSGTLDLQMGGPGTLDEQQLRRSVYFMVKRSQLSRTLQLFDAPDAVLSVGNRSTTITAPQALLFLNSSLVRTHARDFAQRLLPAARESRPIAIRTAYELALGRLPTTTEAADSVAFLDQQLLAYRDQDSERALALALEDFGQVLFGLNEFVFVE